MEYISLFFTAFVAATFFPLSSEALLVALLYQQHSAFWLSVVAITGNSLGACVNWYLGKQCLHLQHKKWFPVKPSQLARAQTQFQRYGIFSLLFSWIPVLGDPLTLLAGMMRVDFWKFLLLVVIGKSLRYTFIMFITLKIIEP